MKNYEQITGKKDIGIMAGSMVAVDLMFLSATGYAIYQYFNHAANAVTQNIVQYQPILQSTLEQVCQK